MARDYCSQVNSPHPGFPDILCYPVIGGRASMSDLVKQVSLRVDLPEEFIRMLGGEGTAAPEELKKLAAMELVRSDRLAFTRAAELLGIPQSEFIRYLSDH